MGTGEGFDVSLGAGEGCSTGAALGAGTGTAVGTVETDGGQVAVGSPVGDAVGRAQPSIATMLMLASAEM